MTKRKPIRARGKLELSRYFQELRQGEYVAVKIEKSVTLNFPERINGRTGTIEGKRGKVYIVKIKDIKKDKLYLIEPIHLKKIKVNK